jgi:hypothetical protein
MSRTGTVTLSSAVLGAILGHLTRWWQRATSEQRIAGEQWYALARTAIRAMARKHGVSESIAAGVVAAMSPRLHWARNLQVAEEILAGKTPAGVLRRNVRRARAVLQRGSPLRVLSGPKVRAFYRALRGDPSATVVDVWILRAAGLGTDSPTERVYAAVSAALTMLASRVRKPVSAVQAILWVAARGSAT